MDAPRTAPMRWVPRLSTTQVPVVLTRLVWRYQAEQTTRVFRSARDAALYLCIVFKTETITETAVARCAEGEKEGSVFGTVHNARYADQMACNKFGPVCKVQKVEKFDNEKRMSSFFRYRQRPDSVCSTASASPSPTRLLPSPQNMLRPIAPPPSSPFAAPGYGPPEIQEHVDGESYMLVPIPGYRAPAVNERKIHHMHVNGVDTFNLAMGTVDRATDDGGLSFPAAASKHEQENGQDLETEHEPVGPAEDDALPSHLQSHLATSNLVISGDDPGETDPPPPPQEAPEMRAGWNGDRDRVSYSRRGQSREADVLDVYKQRLSPCLGVLSGFYPSDCAILRMVADSDVTIVPTDPNLKFDPKLFDNYVAVVLAILNINTEFDSLKIIESVVQNSGGVSVQGANVIKSRCERIDKVCYNLISRNQPTLDINTVSSASLKMKMNDQKKKQCWESFKSGDIYKDLCKLHSPKGRIVRDLRLSLEDDKTVLLGAVIGEEFDRVEAMLRQSKKNHRDELMFNIIHKSALRRLGLAEHANRIVVSSPLLWRGQK